MTKKEFDNHPGWRWCTPQGARDQVLLLGLQTTFREKLEWLEEAETLALRLQGKLDAPPASQRPARNDAPIKSGKLKSEIRSQKSEVRNEEQERKAEEQKAEDKNGKRKTKVES